ncbi:hypothetical protein ANSO36C_30540 [Nostoc cf. commune SO-36]|uniref:Uncharacterized protein n=2 Tax=Nostoc commune TaxID=1178 RepID=A0ABN6Q5I4_NOSCO|nr:hypothetical protein ANSO36C_30540 [Nostoc cf. commune SO-36]
MSDFELTLNLKVVKDRKKIMDLQTIKERITAVQSKREYLLGLLEQPNLGTLRIDVNQALEELDELIDEFRRTIPVE